MPLPAAGTPAAASVADMGASCDHVGICVVTDADVFQITDQLIPVMRKGSRIAIHSTILPESCIKLAAQCAARGIGLGIAKRLAQEGCAVIVWDHDADAFDAAAAGRLSKLGPEGFVVALDTTQNLLSRFAGLTVRLVADRVPMAWQARVRRQDGGIFFIGLDRYADLEALLAALRAEGIAIDELALQETDLEHVFLRIMSASGPPTAPRETA